MAKRPALVFLHAVAFAAAGLGGWYVLSYVAAPVASTAGSIGVITLFLVWQFLLVFFASGVLLAGYAYEDTEMLIGFLLGLVLGNFCGWSVAGYGGLCFGTGAGTIVGPAAGWCRSRILPLLFELED